MTPAALPATAPVPMGTGILADVIAWVERLVTVAGAPGAGLAVALESVFPPIPSEVVLPLAGFAAAEGHFSLWSALVWTTLGSVVGAWVLALLGRRLGVERLRAVARRLPLADERDIDRSMAWFDRHGPAAVFLGRMVPGVRSLVSIPAGLNGMPAATFTLYTALGSLVWNGVLLVAGHQLGQH